MGNNLSTCWKQARPTVGVSTSPGTRRNEVSDIINLDDIFAQYAQEMLGQKYKTLHKIGTEELIINQDTEILYDYEKEGKNKIPVDTSKDYSIIKNNSDAVVKREVSTGVTTKCSCQFSQTRGFRLSADVSVEVGLPSIMGITANAGAEFDLSKTTTKTREREKSYAQKTEVEIPPRSKMFVSTYTQKTTYKMTFSLGVSLQGSVSIQMQEDSGKIKTEKGDIVEIFQKCGKGTAFKIAKDSDGKKRVYLSIDGTCESVKTIDEVEVTDNKEEIFQESVKRYYELNLTRFQPVAWNDTFSLAYSDIFTELQLIQKQPKVQKESWSVKENQRKRLNSLDDVFESEVQTPRCILIEGDAGGGKTTFLSKEALDAVSQRTNLGRSYDFILLIRLREVKKGETIEKMVLDQCIPKIKGIDEKIIEEILQKREARVLFLLDGYDELRPGAKEAGQAIPQLLSGKFYLNSTIVITSRLSAGVHKFTHPDCHVHITGFSPEHVKTYVRLYFAENPDLAEQLIGKIFKPGESGEVKTTLSESLLITDLIHTPIFLMLVCLMWQENPEMVSPGTITGLYSNLLTCLTRTLCKRKGEVMLGDKLPANVGNSLLELGKLALEALLRNETLIDPTEVGGNTVNWDLMLELGVVSLQISASRLHPRKQLSFSHKTMQEFLAGRYAGYALLNQDIDVDKLLQLTSIAKAIEYANLLLFTCGCGSTVACDVMKELSNLSNNEFSHLQVVDFKGECHVPVKPEVKRSVDSYRSFVLLCLDILNERKESDILQAVSQALPIIIVDNFTNSKQHAALKYYLENIQPSQLPERVLLEISIGHDTNALQYLEQTISSYISDLRLHITLCIVTLSNNCMPRLASVLNNVPDLRALNLKYAHLTPTSLNLLVQGLNLNHVSRLEELDFSINPDLGDNEMKALSAVLGYVKHLTVLNLSEVGMTDVSMSSLAQHMSHLSSLRELDVSHNYIRDNGLESLTNVLHNFTAMCVLVLASTGISSFGVRKLVRVLCRLTGLIKLDISRNKLGDVLECLDCILPKLTAMRVLILCGTFIRDNGILAVCGRLPPTLQVLDVNSNDITNSGIISLIQSLGESLTTVSPRNITLRELYIGRNSGVTGYGLQTVAYLLRKLPALTRLDLSGCPDSPPYLQSKHAKALAEAIHDLPDLEWLNLRYISMGNAAFLDVAQAAEQHPTLKELWHSRV